MSFVEYNQLEDVYNRKYLEIEQIRREYPHIVQVFKNSRFAPEIVKGLSLALDDLEGRPLIVRSSSLLEDRMGAAFSGKYKSLFLPNVGTKGERLTALMDAIAEVYASLFGPDPIEYRAERNLLDLHEEMGIMIQEVVGHARRPLLPAVVRRRRLQQQRVPLVAAHQARGRPGAPGARPRDARRGPRRRRLPDPRRARPAGPARQRHARGDPALRPAEDRRHQPRDAAVRDGRRGRPVPRVRPRLPGARPDRLGATTARASTGPVGFGWDPAESHTVVTFDGLVSGTPFMARMRALLKLLRERIGTPVDIEFASDGKDLYLLQCRPQSFSSDAVPSAIPRDLPRDRVRVRRQQVRLERPRARHHAHRLRGSRRSTTASRASTT